MARRDVVVIAASAGGIEALRDVLAGVPTDFGAEIPSTAQLLDSATALVVTAVPACAFATVVAPVGGVLTAMAASDPRGLQFERLQMQLGEGPSRDAATAGIALYVADLAAETRWTEFVPRAIAAGVRSVLSVAIGAETGAALSLYAAEPDAFGESASADAGRFADHIRLVFGTMELHEQDVAIVEQLRAGLESRTLIGQAQGILMERERITAEAAFEILRTASQHTNVKLRAVASRVVETGEVSLPAVGEDRPSATRPEVATPPKAAATFPEAWTTLPRGSDNAALTRDTGGRMRLVDGRYECAQCGAVLAIAPEAEPMVVFHAAGGQSTIRVISVDGREVHRCEVGDRQPDPKH